MKMIRVLGVAAAGILVGSTMAGAQSPVLQPVQKSPWLVGFYVGVLSPQRFIDILTTPWNTRFERSYLAALNVTYVAHEFESIPLNFEIDGALGKRFGRDDEWEVGVLPMVRWKWFPWNDTLYTNFRLGLIGPSFASDVSPAELDKSGTRRGSRFLNFLVPEVTFSSGPDAGWEAFLRIHHRSGGFGLINGTYGGSNYVSAGYRQRF